MSGSGSGSGGDGHAQGGEGLLAALSARPGGPELLGLAATRADLALVGGATRDLLLGREPRELDVAVEGAADALAEQLAERIGRERCTIIVHGRFGTALLSWPDGRIDIAERRAESYAAPGALPEVRAGSPEQDLARRDFTVNAIALALGGPERGRLQAVPGAFEDLAAGRLRVLHERSFVEDPTRLLRLARYQARLGFTPEPDTAALAASALAEGVLASVSGARVGAELRLALAEAEPLAALGALAALGVLAAIDPRMRVDAQLTRRALSALPRDGRPDLLALAALLLPLTEDPGHDPEPAIFELLDRLEFTAGQRERASRSALLAPALALELALVRSPSAVRDAVASAPPETVALAGALGAEQGQPHVWEAAGSWLATWRHVRLSITGEDLLAAGVPAGPEVGLRLASALRGRLDGEVADGREAELRAALEATV